MRYNCNRKFHLADDKLVDVEQLGQPRLQSNTKRHSSEGINQESEYTRPDMPAIYTQSKCNHESTQDALKMHSRCTHDTLMMQATHG